jgi:hypothetical protein
LLAAALVVAFFVRIAMERSHYIMTRPLSTPLWSRAVASARERRRDAREVFAVHRVARADRLRARAEVATSMVHS